MKLRQDCKLGRVVPVAMQNPPQLRGLTLAMVGDFNPTIFQPSWFSSEKLLTVEEAKDAIVHIIHPDVTSFGLPWLTLTVQRERFDAVCLAQPYFERVAGLVSQTFQFLRHTPIRMMGINNEAHYRASSTDTWHAIGHKLAPKEFWKEFFPSPGLQSLTIRQIPRTDNLSGHCQVTVEPSARITSGVYIVINDHYVIDGQQMLGASKAVELLRTKWSDSVAFSDRVFSRISEQL
jgi:hypothetical protein